MPYEKLTLGIHPHYTMNRFHTRRRRTLAPIAMSASSNQQASAAETKRQVRRFWNVHPCGAQFSAATPGSRAFFDEVTAYRYRTEPHLRQVTRFAEYAQKDVLEIGCGLGLDLAQYARGGARVVGTELSEVSLQLARQCFAAYGLPGVFLVADAENLPFAEAAFDLVYAHGVLHHTPNTEKAIAEIYRVLRPGGRTLVMLYHKHSLNYYWGIMLLRRLGRWLLRIKHSPAWIHQLTGLDLEKLRQHQHRLRQRVTAQQWLSMNTDGPENPLSKVYTRRQARGLFRQFRQLETSVFYLKKETCFPGLARFLPATLDRALGRWLGWHLFIWAEKPTEVTTSARSG